MAKMFISIARFQVTNNSIPPACNTNEALVAYELQKHLFFICEQCYPMTSPYGNSLFFLHWISIWSPGRNLLKQSEIWSSWAEVLAGGALSRFHSTPSSVTTVLRPWGGYLHKAWTKIQLHIKHKNKTSMKVPSAKCFISLKLFSFLNFALDRSLHTLQEKCQSGDHI